MQGSLSEFSLIDAIAGRRSRRFGKGMEMPSGPLAYRSEAEPLSLSELERSILVAAGTGVTGWSFGVPHGPDRPEEHAHYTQRFTGRTAPTAAGIGTPTLFATDDSGTYFTNTRDALPDRAVGSTGGREALDAMVETVRTHTERLSERRLDLPQAAPHMLEPNLWMANAPGSTLFMPVADASEQVLGFMAMALANGNMLIDDVAGRPAGNLAPFVRSGLLREDKRIPLTVLQQMAYEANVSELAFVGHNIMLMMQAMGLGGLYLSGLNRWSILGAFGDSGIQGLRFRFVKDPRWVLPNPVGLDGHIEGLCPPYVADMRQAVGIFVERKFGPRGAYDPSTPGAWGETEAIKRGVSPYSEEFVDCLGEVAQYVYDTYGKFPNTFTTMVLSGYVQAVHLDTDFYDTHYRPGAPTSPRTPTTWSTGTQTPRQYDPPTAESRPACQNEDASRMSLRPESGRPPVVSARSPVQSSIGWYASATSLTPPWASLPVESGKSGPESESEARGSGTRACRSLSAASPPRCRWRP